MAATARRTAEKQGAQKKKKPDEDFNQNEEFNQTKSLKGN